ncbi:MAG: hypothetical protein AB2A00_39810, partial [Myxococcota bacterium]
MAASEGTHTRRTRSGGKREGTRSGRSSSPGRAKDHPFSDEDVFSSADELAAAQEDRRDRTWRTVGVLVVDPGVGEDGPVPRGLHALGLDVVTVGTGQAAREELGARPFHAVLLVLGPDASWARLLLQV